MEDEDKWLNEFSNRCFRDVADQDYIAARALFRNGLLPQYLWQAQQALEKYLKAIFLYHRIPAKKVGHDLEKALELLTRLPFPLELSHPNREFLMYLAGIGENRYFQRPYFVRGAAMTELDNAVWELRWYCRVLATESVTTDPAQTVEMDIHREKLKRISENIRSKKTGPQIKGGYLERVLSDKKHISRNALIWRNPFFSLRPKKRLRVPTVLHFSNPPLSMNPQFLDIVVKYVQISKRDQDAYLALMAKRRA